jgi:hypothetical protein
VNTARNAWRRNLAPRSRRRRRSLPGPHQKNTSLKESKERRRAQPALQAQMDIPDTEVYELSGESLSLRKNLKEAVEALDKDGCCYLGKVLISPPVELALSSGGRHGDVC